MEYLGNDGVVRHVVDSGCCCFFLCVCFFKNRFEGCCGHSFEKVAFLLFFALFVCCFCGAEHVKHGCPKGCPEAFRRALGVSLEGPWRLFVRSRRVPRGIRTDLERIHTHLKRKLEKFENFGGPCWRHFRSKIFNFWC